MPREQQHDPAPRHPSTILVVEDDAAIQDVVCSILRAEGFNTVSAGDGAAVIDVVAREPIDLVVLDLMLPDISGFEVCRRLRARGDASLPIVMLTALGTQEQVISGLELGADDYIVKPFDPRELVLRIKSLLRRSRQTIDAERELEELAEADRRSRAAAAAAHGDVELERALRRELLHNVTTHIRSLSRVADVAVRRFPAGPLREVVEQLRMRIRGASLTYEIAASLDDEPVDAGNLVQTISSSLKDLYRPWRRVVVKVCGPELYIPATAASPLALIINELVTNALRHAFPEMRYGSVTITYGENGGILAFAVVDDGVGYDVSRPSSGRGRPAIAALVHELGGTIEWSSSAAGTRVAGQYPLGRPTEYAETSAALPGHESSSSQQA